MQQQDQQEFDPEMEKELEKIIDELPEELPAIDTDLPDVTLPLAEPYFSLIRVGKKKNHCVKGSPKHLSLVSKPVKKVLFRNGYQPTSPALLMELLTAPRLVKVDSMENNSKNVFGDLIKCISQWKYNLALLILMHRLVYST